MTNNNSLLNGLPAGAKITVETLDGKRVSYVKATKEQILRRDYANLIGQPITVTDAAEKYGIQRDTILWWKKSGFISVLKDGYRMEVDEADVAYCSKIYNERKNSGTLSGAPLLDNDGLPYVLKHPDLSVYRLKRRRQLA
jgi:hypothetical protein